MASREAGNIPRIAGLPCGTAVIAACLDLDVSSFAGRHAAGAQIDQWLEVELELIRSQGLAQVEFEGAPFLRCFLHLKAEKR
jgi:hypothetical protein